jgi:glycosyltransferase involved in cell wall biosynthesis
MRIALVAPRWVPIPPPAYGGIELVVDHLARGLQAAGHEVLLHAPSGSTCPVPMTACADEASQEVGPGASAAELHHVVAGYEEIANWGPDIVHDHTLAGPLYAGLLDVPVVTTNHGPFTGRLRDLFRTISTVAPVIAISHHQASTAPGVAIAAVIHHGIDVDRVAPGRGDGGYALFLGRMSPTKGVHLAARAAREAGVPLRIASRLTEPAEHAYFAEEVAPLLGGGVRYVGEVGGAAKAALLEGATCLLNPIDWPEPFGMVMIESLARGTPVVATPNGSVPELIEDGVTGFVRSSVTGLAEAIDAAPRLDRTHCRRVAAHRFSTRRMVADHVRAYEQVLAGRSPRRVA